ncbi:hypothetical protein L1887_44551 [Cichorium endivia]|nr:hypothetical protein L1887_44551 [Cichorium endivia]
MKASAFHLLATPVRNVDPGTWSGCYLSLPPSPCPPSSLAPSPLPPVHPLALDKHGHAIAIVQLGLVCRKGRGGACCCAACSQVHHLAQHALRRVRHEPTAS